MKLLSCALLVFCLVAATRRTGITGNLVWLDWNANPPSDNVTNYILYMGTQSGTYEAKIVLGNQTSVQVIKNHPVTYCAISAVNRNGESPKSSEVSFIQ